MSRIAIFDSGVGGLSIYQAVSAKLPQHEYVFVSDNLAYPYGTKAEDELTARVVGVMRHLVKDLQPDLVVVACNTASTVVLPLLRQEHSIPFVGVVPAIKPAAQLSKTRCIGLLATPATIARPYTDELIAEFAGDCDIIKVGSSKLVSFAEAKIRDIAFDREQLNTELRPFLERSDCDTLVLACTHFPLLNKEISDFFKANNRQISLVDSAAAIARRVDNLLKNIDSADNSRGSRAVFTEDVSSEIELCAALAKLGIAYQDEILMQ